MATDYDLVVIGSGSAARTVAMTCNEAGWRVAVVDHRPLGGTCVLRGCDPKKVLISGAEAVESARRMKGGGVEGDLRIDWPELMRFKRTFTDSVPESQARRYSDRGINVYRGTAAFTGARALSVDGSDLAARHFVLATGAEPVALPIPGAEYLIDSAAFLELDRLPERLVLVGGGYIAAEFAHLAARAGAEVTVLQRGPRMLTGFDPDLVDRLMAKFEALGVRVCTNAEVTAIEAGGDGYEVQTAGDAGSMTFTADAVVHAAGRAPALADLQPQCAGIEMGDRGPRLNDFLQSTSNPAVYAAGDASATGPPLTPAASHDGSVVAANLLNGNERRPDYRGVPSVAFTLPPLARVGLGEDAAREQGLRFRVSGQETGEWYSNRRLREPVAGHKVLVEEGSERILGAHLLGPHADELINVFALAMRHDLATDQLRDTPFAYPTGASDISSML